MKQSTIFASYGVIGHEGEPVWAVATVEGAVDADRVTVELPDDFEFCENAFGETLVTDSDENSCPLTLCLRKTSKIPMLTFPSGDTWRNVPLTIVAREGWTVWA